MAFGDLKGSLNGGGASITGGAGTATGSVAVALQDLVIVMVAEAAANTVTTVTANLAGAYTAVNAGTLSSGAAGRLYYRLITDSGTLTSVNCTMTTSGNDYAIAVAVFEGPFTASPLDRAPANTVDAATPFTCAATTALSQANELIVAGLSILRGQTATTATAPLLLAVNRASSTANAANSVSATIGRQVVSATTSVTPVFASTGTITGGVQCVATFRQGSVEFTTGSAAGLGAAAGSATTDAYGVGSSAGIGSANAVGSSTTASYSSGFIADTTKVFPTTGGGTTDPIDTTGANCLVVYWSNSTSVSGLNISDNYGNAWTAGVLASNRPSGADVQSRWAWVNTTTPLVGPGHTFTITGTNGYLTVHFTAWRSGTAWSRTASATGNGALPHGTTSVTLTPSAGDLILTGAASNDTLTTVSSGFTVLGDVPSGATNFATAYAYGIAPSTSAVNPVWSGAGDASVITNLFSGTWLDGGTGSASAFGAASAVGINDTGVGSASALATATGVSPSAATVVLIAHAEGYGGVSGGITNSVDTTGANLLILHLNSYIPGGTLAFSDSKSNVWTLLGTRDTANNGRDYVYYANSQTPNVGTGHTVTHSGSNVYSSAELLAFSHDGPWRLDEIQGSVVTLPAAGPSLTTDEPDELIISTVTGDGTSAFTAVSGDLAIITSCPGVSGTTFATASAYKVQSSIATVQATWTATNPNSTAIQLFAFKPHVLEEGVYLVTSFAPTTPRNNFPGYVGVKFQASNTAEHRYNRLGIRASTSNTGDHTVYLHTYTGSSLDNTLLRSAVIDLTGSTEGTWYYAEIPEITLSYLTQYQITTDVYIGGQYWAEGPVTLLGAVPGQTASCYSSGDSMVSYNAGEMFCGVDLALIEEGAVDVTGAGAAAAVGLAAGSGVSDIRVAGVAAAIGAASASGRADTPGVGSAAALGAAAGTSAAGLDANGAGTAAAAATVAAGGRADSRAGGAAAGTGTAAAAGVEGRQAAGTALGLGTAAGATRSDARSAATSSALGTATGASTSEVHVPATGTAAATATAAAFADLGYATATAAATSAASGTGRADFRAAATAAATSSTGASSRVDFRAAGSAAASGFARAVMLVVGTAAASSTASASGRLDARAGGAAAATGAALAATTSDAFSAAVAAALGTAASYSVEPGSAAKTVELRGNLPASVTLTGHATATPTLTGRLPGSPHLTGNMGV